VHFEVLESSLDGNHSSICREGYAFLCTLLSFLNIGVNSPVPTARWGHVTAQRDFPKPVFFVLGGRCTTGHLPRQASSLWAYKRLPIGALSDLWEFSLVERLWRMIAANPLETGLVFATALPFRDPDRLLVVGGAQHASAVRNPTALAS
jgi:hypothetical protein